MLKSIKLFVPKSGPLKIGGQEIYNYLSYRCYILDLVKTGQVPVVFEKKKLMHNRWQQVTRMIQGTQWNVNAQQMTTGHSHDSGDPMKC